MTLKMMNPFYFLCFFILWAGSIQAQEDTAVIQLRSRVKKDAILLRWAPSTAISWQQTNRSGFRLERYTMVRNKQVLPEPEKKVCNLKALPLLQWDSLIQNNDQAAIVAQALYGETFEVSGGNKEDLAYMITLSQELEQRFSFSLFAADHSFEVACWAGWGYRDTDVKPGERYLYRIVPDIPEEESLLIKPGSTYTSLDEYEELPPPSGLSGIFGDKQVQLVWDYERLKGVYNAYYIEKSTDSLRFTRLEGLPVSRLQHRNADPRIFYTDSFPDNASPIYYRIVGLTAFGETGPPSRILSGKGKNRLSSVPHITRLLVNEKEELELDWDFDGEETSFIKGFELQRADQEKGPYTAVKQKISPGSRSLVFGPLRASDYYVVAALPPDGKPLLSFPVLVQPLDTLPPAVPSGLKGNIDSNGVLRLSWKPNTEADMLGYKVYRGMHAQEELFSIFDIALQDTVWVDTLDLYTLNTHVYYAVSAADLRYNQSDLCPVLALTLPDKLAPSAPVISHYHINEKGIEIRWINSPQAVKHRIYRISKNDSSASLLAELDSSRASVYTDTSAEIHTLYQYTITAVKKNGLESEASPVLTVSTPFRKETDDQLERFDVVIDKENRMIKLSWKHQLKEVQYYELFKSEDEQKLSLWKTLPAEELETYDTDLIINGSYTYLIRALFKDGKNSSAKKIHFTF